MTPLLRLLLHRRKERALLLSHIAKQVSLMSISFSGLHNDTILLSKPILESLSKVRYSLPEGSNVSFKSMLESLLPHNNSPLRSDSSVAEINCNAKDFILCCAALASSAGATYDQLSWIPSSLSLVANSAFQELSRAFSDSLASKQSSKIIEELGLENSVPAEKKLVIAFMPELMPLLKERIKESYVDNMDVSDEISAATARVPAAYAIVAAYQFRWFIMQVSYPHLGKLCTSVIPCAQTTLDHWSPEVKDVRNTVYTYRCRGKGQGMISIIHLANNVNSAELGWYGDVILDACLQNIASSDEIWVYVVEMSVLLATSTQQGNPRSSWYEKLLNEMLSHLERQPKNKERRIAWLKHIDPLFSGLGLVLLAHFRRIFPLFFKWMHADDDETVVLVLDRVKTVIKLTWIRNSPYTERLVDELVILYKDAALKIAREDIRAHVLQILNLLQQCKGFQFEVAWNKHKDDPNLTAFLTSFSRKSCNGCSMNGTRLCCTCGLEFRDYGSLRRS